MHVGTEIAELQPDAAALPVDDPQRAGFGCLPGAPRRRIARRASGRQCVEESPNIRLPVTNEPADANKRNADSGDAILLQCAARALGDLLYVTIRKQLVEHGYYLLTMRRGGAPQEIASYRCPK